MRLRIETTAPLPVLKTWFTVTRGTFGFGTRTIEDLRKRLIAKFKLPKEIRLQLNGYDLLEDEPVEELLEKDDLIQYVYPLH